MQMPWTPDLSGPLASPPPGGTLGNLAGGNFQMGALAPPTFNAPPPVSLPAIPTPAPFNYPEFHGPTGQQLLDTDPGYQFRLGEGRQSIQNSLAQQGLGTSGPAAKALEDYAQNFASNEYQNAFNRALGTYNTNFGTAYNSYLTNANVPLNIWAANAAQGNTQFGQGLQAAQAAYAPQFAGWQAGINLAPQAYGAAYQNQSDLYNQAWQQYLQQIQQQQYNQQWPFQALNSLAGAGQQAAAY